MLPKPTKEQWSRWHQLLDKAAASCLEKHPGHLHEAAEAMTEMVRGDPRLREAMLEVLVKEACHDRIRRRLQVANQSAWHQTDPFDPTSRGDRLKRAAKTSRYYRLMDYNLMGGVPLSLATRVQVENNAHFQDRQANRMAQTALWLGLIKDRMDPTKKKQVVRDVLTEEDLRELQRVAIDTFAVPKNGAKAPASESETTE
jgi:hypothetical protein